MPFNKSLAIKNLLENSSKNLGGLELERDKQKRIFEYVNNRTKIDKKYIKRYSDILSYWDNTENMRIDDKSQQYENRIIAMLRQLVETVKTLQQFNDIELLLPFMDELNSYGIYLNVQNSALDDFSSKVSKCEKDVKLKMNDAVNCQHAICHLADNVKISDARTAQNINYTHKVDYRDIAEVYHKAKSKKGTRKRTNVIERFDLASIAANNVENVLKG